MKAIKKIPAAVPAQGFKITHNNFSFRYLFFYYLKIIFSNATQWAHPISWDILKSCSWCDTTLWIPDSGIINPITNGASVLFHFFNYYKVNTFNPKTVPPHVLFTTCQKN